MPFRSLTRGGGFSANLQLPVPDPIALQYALKWFGSGPVSKIANKYHRAQVSLDRLKDDIYEFSRSHVSRINDPSYDAIYASVLKEFTPSSPIIPWTNGKVFKSDKIPRSSAAGFPYHGKTKGDIVDDPIECNNIRRQWHAVGAGYNVKFPDTKVYFRAQICDPDTEKIRGTWGYPSAVFFEEARFLYPYLEWLKDRTDSFPLAYGLEMANGGMKYIHEMANLSPNSYFLMLDWKKFDKTIPPWLIRDAFSIFFHAFDLAHVLDSDGLMWEVDPEKTKNRIKKLINYFINTPFQLSDGERFMKDGGVPSGSGFTNIIDSIVNALVTRYCIYHTAGSIWISDMYLGDDGVIVLHGPLSIESMADFALQYFGMIVNTSKSYITNNPINIQFLGFYNMYGVPMRSQDFIIASFIFPERFYGTPDPSFTAIRALGQLWSTLNPLQAVSWLNILENIITDYNIDFMATLTDYDKRKFFKFLFTLGFRMDEITLPEKVGHIIPSVAPKFSCKRKPKIFRGSLSELYQYLENTTIWKTD